MKLAQKQSPVFRPLSTAAAFAAATVLFICVFFGHGVFDRSGWSTTADGNVRYLNRQGRPLKGWQEIDGDLRYLDQQGSPLTGWQEIDGSTHYFSADNKGAMAVGLFEIDGQKFFFDEAGISVSGWVTHDGRR